MPDLNTKTLIELDTVNNLDNNDTILVESDGLMKRVSGSLGGGVYVLDVSGFYNEEEELEY